MATWWSCTREATRGRAPPPGISQRELLGLCKFGYSGIEGDLKAGTEYKCTDTRLADAATFKSYVEEMLSQESRVAR